MYDHIKVSLQHTGETTQGILEVNDFQGVIMLRKEVSLTSGTNDFVLEIPASLPAGVYETNLRTTGKVYGARFVKMRAPAGGKDGGQSVECYHFASLRETFASSREINQAP
ncbi:MAG: hypothetical protein IPJ82_05785 [Lewinellaceae bacterium]|nr:hypothetical protein [Lewinellaceae bacterium]